MSKGHQTTTHITNKMKRLSSIVPAMCGMVSLLLNFPAQLKIIYSLKILSSVDNANQKVFSILNKFGLLAISRILIVRNQ